MKAPRPTAAYAALMVQTTISAFTYLAAKQALHELAPAALAMLRFIGASVLLVPLLTWLTPHRWPPRAWWRRIALLALLAVPLNQGFFLGGLATAGTTRCAPWTPAAWRSSRTCSPS